VPDNLKSGITRADFYDPDVNRVYSEMAEHYGSAVLPARARKPQDKAGVESNVRFIQTHILGRLRHRVFRSLVELNEAIRELLPVINGRPMQRYHRSRTQRFDELDKPNATSLPTEDFHITEIKDQVKVNDDHHVHFRGHYYSVPWRLTGARVDLWYGADQLQVYHDRERVAIHKVSMKLGGYTTNDQHRPPNHLFMNKLNPLWVLSQAEKIGPETHKIIRRLLEARPRHPDIPIRKGLGIIELARDYPPEQVERATIWAFDHGQFRLQDIRTILEQGLSNENFPSGSSAPKHCTQHDNIRGSDHYQHLSQTIFNQEESA